MKKIYFVITILIVTTASLQAQNRKYIGNFSLFQQYYNPALTGLEGSIIKTLYRDQWTGYEDAPRTLFLSGEFDLATLSGPRAETGAASVAGKHFLGAAILNDTFGPFKQGEFSLSYGTRVQLSENMSLRGGAALTYSSTTLDASKLTFDNLDDPEYLDLLGTNDNQVQKLDLNIGLMLTGPDYYVGYSIQDLAQGKAMIGHHYMEGTFPLHHVVQGGVRKGFSDQFGLVFNGIYHYDTKLKETVEGQLKAVINNTFWAGFGYRYDLAYTFTAGLRLKNQFRIGYLREVATGKAEGINVGSNEIMITYNLFPLVNAGSKLTIW